MTNLDTAGAISFATRYNVAVFPITPNAKLPFCGKGGCANASTDPATIKELWADRRNLNIGIEASRSSLVLLDCDGKGDGRDGFASLEALEAKHGKLPETLKVKTPNGGIHYYFRRPQGAVVYNRKDDPRIGKGLEIRANNQYVVAPPSMIDGRAYEFVDPAAPIADCPQWLIALTHELPKATPQPVPKYTPIDDGEGMRRYVNKVPAASEGDRNNAAFKLAGHLWAFQNATDGEVLACMESWNNRNVPPLDDIELQQTVWSAKHNGTPREPKVTRQTEHQQIDIEAMYALMRQQTAAPAPVAPAVAAPAKRARRIAANTLIEDESIVKKEIIIDGLVRRGEVCNVVAAPKARKSWFVHDLAISLEHGTEWMGFQCNKSRVLIIDNELHLGTLKSRLSTLYDAKEMKPTSDLEIVATRGEALDISHIPELVHDGRFDVVILDALYRFFPPKFDENSNAMMTALYNQLDKIAGYTGCAIFVVHHTSKGHQQGKSTTDIGAGAGAQSRAADGHITIRPQKQNEDTAKAEMVTIDMVARSFAPIKSFVATWTYPRWERSGDVEPCQIEDGKARLTTQQFALKYFNDVWQGRAVIAQRAFEDGVSDSKFRRLLDAAKEMGLFEEMKDPQDPKKKVFRRKMDQAF